MATITNIYYDCLERIFDFLDLRSLLNVADTYKRLQIAAAAKFSDAYGKKPVHLIIHKNKCIPLLLNADEIYIRGSKLQFPFLRCFGAKVTHLYVDHHSDSGRAYKTLLLQYLNQYCGNALKTLVHPRNESFLYGDSFKNLDWIYRIRK